MLCFLPAGLLLAFTSSVRTVFCCRSSGGRAPPEYQSGGGGPFFLCSHCTCLCCSRLSWGWGGGLGLGWGEAAHKAPRMLLVQKGATVCLFPVDFRISSRWKRKRQILLESQGILRQKSHGGRNRQDYLRRELDFNEEKYCTERKGGLSGRETGGRALSEESGFLQKE